MQTFKPAVAVDIPPKTLGQKPKAHFLTIIEDLFTPQECAGFIHKFTGDGAKVTLVDNGLAKYRRMAFTDTLLAESLYAKVQHLVPPEFNVVCANSTFRLSEYQQGWEFKTHRDGINQDANGNRSVITVNVFLNNPRDLVGGETDFFHDDHTLRRSVSPKIGRASMFDSQQSHCGCQVKAGKKYLLRTDLMTHN